MADKEPETIGRYLISRLPSDEQAARYRQAVAGLPLAAKTASTLSRPRLLPYIDAYDAFFRPASDLRRRLYLMFSILEASPKNTDLFLPRQISFFTTARYGVRAVYRLVVGIIIVKVRSL